MHKVDAPVRKQRKRGWKARSDRLKRKVKWQLATFYKKYSGPALALAAMLTFLAALMWLWSKAGYHKDEFGPKVLSSFSSFLIALVALWAGHGLKKRQEEAANARAELALNVELSIHVLPHEPRVVIEAEVRVKNISNKTWNLPLVYVFIQPIGTSNGHKGNLPAEIPTPDLWELRGTNIARFSNTMTRLSPDEEEVFSRAYILDEHNAKISPYFLVLAEVVGAPDSWEFDEETRKEFDRFMDGEPQGEGTAPQVQSIRDTYMTIETTEKSLRKIYGYGKRALILPPDQRPDGTQERRIDEFNSLHFKDMLDQTMMWSRRKVVCVAQTDPLGARRSG